MLVVIPSEIYCSSKKGCKLPPVSIFSLCVCVIVRHVWVSTEPGIGPPWSWSHRELYRVHFDPGHQTQALVMEE